MSEFDTHGGYFAPQGYMRVNAGGSHEENPNGGVQVGVDPEGTPNLLEEGEPVYNDYVYSDNITAEEDVLTSHNLPRKYAGKLYSEIADTFVDDAAETPLDPISNNGLNAMLVRLAEAQEEQKAIQQQRELEEELANLSPEELAELEQMLSQEEAAQQQPIPEEAMQAPVEAPMEAPVEQQQPMMPMMANGGLVNRFVRGGRKPISAFWSPRFDRRTGNTMLIPTGGANYPYFDINLNTFYPGSTRGKSGVRGDGPVVLGGYASTSGYSGVRDGSPLVAPPVEDTVVTDIDTTIPAAQERISTTAPADKPSRGAQTASPVALGIPRRRRADSLPRISSTIPADYTVPDNIIQILDSDEPGFGVNPQAREILGRALATAQAEALPRPATSTIDRVDAVRAIMANQPERSLEPHPERSVEREDNGLLPVWPRYAGAVTSGLLGLYNAFQEPDRYEIPEYNPVLPQARMHFIDPIYNPLDQNQAVNDILAANAGTARAITNSGLGASTQATLLANDYNAGRNMGAARAQVWDANNQRLNDVIARRNQNAGMLGQFDYGQSRDRAYIKNDAAWKNLQMALQEQQMNYAAEGQKYAAIQNQIDSVAQALSNIGRENAAMNMVNGDEAYRYALGRLFDPYYKGTVRKCGGYIKKIKK